MAKLYSQAEWARIQSRFPEEDRVPYSESPDRPAGPSAIAREESGIIGAVSAAKNMPAPEPMDITSQRYTAAAKAAGLTPTPSTAPTPVTSVASSDDLYNTKRRVGYGIDEQGNPVPPTKVSGPRVQSLPEGFTSGPFPKELEKFFGAPGDILGYRINTETDKDGKTFFTLSVANRGAYGEGVTGYSTFGARFTRDASGNYVPYSGPGTKQDGPTGPTGPTGPGATGPTGPGAFYTAPDGKIFTDLNQYNAYITQTQQGVQKTARQSAFDLLLSQFSQYGLGSLVEPLRGLIEQNINPAEFAIKLRETPAYQLRFGANKARINRGLRALSEAEYITLEDSYQDVMRRYGLPETYYRRGELGRQEGFEKFISTDVSPVELEDRIQTAQNRIFNANPEVGIALKMFYPDISNGDILGYVLDPEKGLSNIKRRITAAEIGGSAVSMGLATNVTDAEYLARYGVTKEQAQQGYRNISEILPRGSFLGEIYSKQGMGPYTQATAEKEVFNVPGAAEAAQQRRKLTELETAQFSGTSGVAGGALARERAGQF